MSVCRWRTSSSSTARACSDVSVGSEELEGEEEFDDDDDDDNCDDDCDDICC